MHPLNLHGKITLRNREMKSKLEWLNFRTGGDVASSLGCVVNHLRNGVLYRKRESDDGKAFRWQLILPKTRVSKVFNELHGNPTGDQFSVMKTLQKVFYWNNVRSDVDKRFRICDPCAASKGPR
ncbi:retrovirus-related Pol polyprotein from transposon 412 [Trichonephila clavipes]|nr:retrovirus-related Pol polyprotein from transposon 412 [Trichonephila clavipes]